jgi:hypothetical protein
LEDISVDPKFSGWRSIDEERVAELAEILKGGQIGMNIFGGIVLVKGITDVNGLRVIDDGLSSVLAWKGLKKEWSDSKDAEWDSRCVEVFETGVVVTLASYAEDDRALREAWNAAKHDEENNRYRPTSVAKKLGICYSRFERLKDWGLVTKGLLDIYGKGKASTIQRWAPSAREPLAQWWCVEGPWVGAFGRGCMGMAEGGGLDGW